MKLHVQRACARALMLGFAITLTAASAVFANDGFQPGGGGPTQPFPGTGEIPGGGLEPPRGGDTGGSFSGNAPEVPERPISADTDILVAPEGRNCPSNVRSLFLHNVADAAKRAAATLPIDAPIPPVRAVRASRDALTRGLAKIQGRELYNIVAIDDLTHLRGRALAEHSFGKLDPSLKRALPFDVAEVEQDYAQTLKFIEDYETRTREFVDETASFVAQRDMIKARLELLEENAKLRKKGLPEKPISEKLELPSVTKAGTDDPEILLHDFTDWDAKRLKQQLEDLNKRIRERIGYDWRNPVRLPGTPPHQAAKLAIEQSIQVERALTFYGEFHRLAGANVKQKVPKNIADLLNRTENLFEQNQIGGKLKDAYRPPESARNRMLWLQHRAEAKSLLFKQPLKMTDEARSTLFGFIKNMPKAEQRVLGVDNYTDAFGLLRRAKWGRLIAATAAGGGSVYSFYPAIYEFAISDATKKENCAEMANSDDYGQCVVDYLSEKFPIKYLREVNGSTSFFAEDGTIKDKQILAELDDISRRRKELFKEKNREAELKDSIVMTLREKSIGDDAYRMAMIESPDDAGFRAKLLGNDNTEGYLAFRYPTASKLHHEKIVQILSMDSSTIEYTKKIAELRQVSLAMAQDLEEILWQRQDFLQYGSTGGYYGGGGGYGGGYGGYGGGRGRFPVPGVPGTGGEPGGTAPGGGPAGEPGGAGSGGRRNDPRNPIPVPGFPGGGSPRDRSWIQKRNDFWFRWPEKLE